ncbi:MAG TPA: glycosyl hydrolase, partial [Phycisphaerae bacterium]
MPITKSLVLAILTLATSAGSAFAQAAGEDRMIAPPTTWPSPTSENRLWTRWWWMGNAVDEKNITAQLEKFHAAGIGGVEICPIYGVYGQENNYIDFLSPKWMSMLAHTYRETKRLGMQVDMTTGTGWPFGGSMVADANASQGIVLKSFDHYPTAGELTAGKVVCMMVYPRQGPPQDVTGKKVEAAAGDRFLAAVETGPQQKVKRPAPGAEGNVLDPYSVTSLNKYLEVFDNAFKAFPDIKPRSQFHDSFEYYSASWTPNFLDEFQKRRGYDLRPHLAELNNEDLSGADKETIARVKCDYRETLSDLHLEYMNRWVGWSHEHGGLGRNQAHGGPGNILDVYANADIPECEMFHLYDESQMPFLKLASSAAHVTGKKLSSSESFTWLDEHFNASLAEVKPAADFLFLAGVNHMFLHGIPYSPEDAAWPGWNFYASVNFGPYGGLWRDFPAFTAYVARCQSILQANKPSNDVLLYVPFHEFWSDPVNNDKLMIQFTTPGTWMKPYPYYNVASALWESGYGYDEISDKLLQSAKVNSDGTIDMAGNSYKTIVIPKTPILPPESLKQLINLANQGATIAFQAGIPSDVPGFTDLEKRLAPERPESRWRSW